MSRFLGRPRRAPVAIALLLSAPLFFASLLAASLAIERPHVIAEWVNHAFWAKASSTHPVVRGRTFTDFVLADPTARNEALIWLCALVPEAILVAIGVGAAFLRRGGAYVSCAAGIVIALLLRVPIDRWGRHHTARFPFGVDNVFDGSPSNQIGRGEWEVNAKETIHSIGNVTILLAVGIAAVYLISHWRRVRALTHALPPEAEIPAPALERTAGQR